MSHARLILGSSSPRRKDLLAQIGITPDLIYSPDIDETPHKNELPAAYVARIALGKNDETARSHREAWIITADTTVAVGRRILGKPENEKDAERMVRLLSGRRHAILTAVAVRAPDERLAQRLSESYVRVKRLSDIEIASYLKTGDWQGVAGGYKLQGFFAAFIRHVQGDPSGIIGLPVYDTMQMLRGLGYADRA